MVGNSIIQVSTCPTMLSSSLITVSGGFSNFLPYLPSRPQKKFTQVRVMSADMGHSQPPSSSKKKNPLAVILDVPQNLWRQTLKPLSDFGFGRRSIWEGGVGLFILSGVVLFALSVAWFNRFQLRSRFRKYLAVFEFEQACGICMGTPVRIRGVTVGNVIRVNPSLKSIEAVVEVSLIKMQCSIFCMSHLDAKIYNFFLWLKILLIYMVLVVTQICYLIYCRLKMIKYSYLEIH